MIGVGERSKTKAGMFNRPDTGRAKFMKNETKDQILEQEQIPQIVPVIPTIDVVVFPHMVVPLLILDEKIIKGVEMAMNGTKKVLLLAAKQQDESFQGPIGIQDLYKTGTVGNIMRVMNLPEGGVKVLMQGFAKASVDKILSDQDLLQAEIKPIILTDSEYDATQAESQIKQLLKLVEKIAQSGRMFSPDFQSILMQIHEPDRIADFILSHLNLKVSQAQELLETKNLNDLLNGLYEIINHEFEINNIQEKIKTNARESMNKSQREYYLREQMRAIQQELGEESDSENDDLKRKAQELDLHEEARTEVSRQLRRLDKTAPDSMEATVIRNHLEWVLGMPWNIHTKDDTNLNKAKDILDSHHYGLDEVKDRILDFLSVRSMKEDSHTPILCLFGPPGVGKTSLGQAIAKCLGRKFARISLGGVYDECEIRGHRRTYVGALPGRFIQAIKKAGSCNPLIIIDEIDKIGTSNRGDPSAALLEVLDPEQNHSFYDNYLGVHYDLSKTMFITTANDLSTIPGPLRDRMEIIQLSGYTVDEKLEIAEKHLIQRSLKSTGLEEKGFSLSRNVLTEIASGYTRESGVRELERYIHKLCSKFARSLVENHKAIEFTPENLVEYLGPRKIADERSSRINKIGVCNGLAWTPYGGEVLQVEAVLMPGNGKLILTGQLGDVMKESAQAAVTYSKTHALDFGIDLKVFTDSDLHIHLPAGAVPKDGPSAGITLLSSILSAYTKRPINGDFAMTGELNLQGYVLPIGGLKEKILAAKQHGLSNVIIPMSNKKDLTGLNKLYEGMKLHFVENALEVLNTVLLPRG